MRQTNVHELAIWLTLELKDSVGQPIEQIVFNWLTKPTPPPPISYNHLGEDNGFNSNWKN